MRKLSLTQTASATWAADSTITTDLERIGLLTRVDFVAEVTPSATLTGANQPDGLNRLIQNMRIVGGSQVYINLPADDGCQGGSLIHYLNQLDGLGLGHPDGAITAPARLFTPIKTTFHFGSRPKAMYGRDNPYDLTAFIPAGGESQLRAEWTTSGNDVMDDSVTISSAVGRFILHRVIGHESEIQQEMRAQGVNVLPGYTGMTPAWSARTFATGATTTDYDTETDDLVTGAFLKRVTILAQDATATRTLRASDEVTSIRITSVKTSEVLFQMTAEAIQGYFGAGDQLTANSGASESAGTEKFGADFNAAVAYGVYPIDLRLRGTTPLTPLNADYGWDLRRVQTGDIRLGYIITTRAAGDDRLILFERYQPTQVPLSVASH